MILEGEDQLADHSKGLAYTGMLFTGLIITDSGPKVLEYNARFGDPETQSVLLLLGEDTDLAEIMLACTQQRLHEVHLTINAGFACNVVVVARGYPESYSEGDPIQLLCLMVCNYDLSFREHDIITNVENP